MSNEKLYFLIQPTEGDILSTKQLGGGHSLDIYTDEFLKRNIAKLKAKESKLDNTIFLAQKSFFNALEALPALESQPNKYSTLAPIVRNNLSPLKNYSHALFTEQLL
jgi:hypothetical protein